MDFYSNSRAEAQRWLTMAERLLSTRDLQGTRSFALRARESDPTAVEAADRVIAVADTLLAGETMINNQHDWYGILQVVRSTQNLQPIAYQFRRLALLLHPDRNRVPFADQAFKLISDAWSVLSNPLKKALYDSELNMYSAPTWLGLQEKQMQPQPQQFQQEELHLHLHQQQQQLQQQYQQQHQQPQPLERSPRTMFSKETVEEERVNDNNVTESTRLTQQQTQPTSPTRHQTESTHPTLQQTEPTRPQRQQIESTEQPESDSASFWTACPYCYIIYEYPKAYEECVLRCQTCRRAYDAVAVPTPPVTEKDKYFCCWGFFPLGFSGKPKEKSGSCNWMPISTMFACPLQGQAKVKRQWVYRDDDDDLPVDISDSSEDSEDSEWGSVKRKKNKKAKKLGSASRNVKRVQSETIKNGNKSVPREDNVAASVENVSNASKGESSKKIAAASNVKKHKGKGVAELGKLDLNVKFSSNDVEEPVLRASGRNGTGHGEEDNIEGIGFFEGLDEFLSSLPILNAAAVADDKVKAS